MIPAPCTWRGFFVLAKGHFAGHAKVDELPCRKKRGRTLATPFYQVPEIAADTGAIHQN